jgi:hypothetical protein
MTPITVRLPPHEFQPQRLALLSVEVEHDSFLSKFDHALTLKRSRTNV